MSELKALDIVRAHRTETVAIQGFLEMMAEKGFHLTKTHDDLTDHQQYAMAGAVEGVIPTSGPALDKHLYEFIGTTAKAVEDERQALLDAISG